MRTNIVGYYWIYGVELFAMSEQTNEKLADLLESDLLAWYGPVLTGDALRRCLGYSNMAALRQAIARKKVPIPIFPLKDRRGKFALAKDVAHWLAEQRNQACE